MRTRLLIFLPLTLPTVSTGLRAQGTAFTYQGRLVTNGVPYSGSAEFQFTLWDSVSGGNAVATNTPAVLIVTLDNGLFTVTLDFGSNPFNGQPRFLQTEVRTVNGPFTSLTPRQPLTVTPYALRALNLTTNGLAGTYGNAVTFNNAANTFSGGFSGNGRGITNVGGIGLVNPLQLQRQLYIDASSNLSFGPLISQNVTSNTIFFDTNATQSAVQAAVSVKGNNLWFFPGEYYGLTNIVVTNGVTITFQQATFHYSLIASGPMWKIATNAVEGQQTMLLGSWTLDGGESSTVWESNPKGLTFPLLGYATTPNINGGTGQSYWVDRSGLYIDLADGGVVQGLTVKGFSGYGVFAYNAYGSLAYQHPQTIFIGCTANRNFIGLWPVSTTLDYYNSVSALQPDPMSAHYSKWIGWAISQNTIGMNAGCGNLVVMGCAITANTIGVFMTGNSINGHGVIADNMINHNNAYAMYAYQMDTGYNIHNNQFLGGNTNQGHILFDNCAEITFHDNTCQDQILSFTNAAAANHNGYNFAYNNTYKGTFGTDFRIFTTASACTNLYWNNFSYDTLGSRGRMNNDGTIGPTQSVTNGYGGTVTNVQQFYRGVLTNSFNL